MTNQQGAPEALRTITRYEVVDCIDSKHVPAVIPNGAGPWVRYEDHVAALVEAQQLATHVQNPAEIEHVAGDVSKNGVKSNMAQQPAPSAAAMNFDPHAELRKTWQPGQRWQTRTMRHGVWGNWSDTISGRPLWFAHQQYRRHPDEIATQPSPTPQADSQPAPVLDYPPLPATYYLAGGVVRTWDEGQMRAAINADRAARAPADSQPAPEYVGNGMFKGETIEKAAEHWANWCDVRCMTGLSEFLRVVAARALEDSQPAPQGETNVQLDIDSNPATPGQQRDVAGPVAVGQPVGHRSDQATGDPQAQGDKLLIVAERNIRSFLRSAVFKSESDREAALNCVDVLWEAARAQADSVTAPAATPTAASIAWTALRDLTDPLGEVGVKIMGHVRIYAQRQYEAGLTEGRATPPAQVADGVLEDAAFEAVRKKLCALPRFSFLSDGYGIPVRRIPDKSAGSWVAFDAVHALFDPVAVDAARKQGSE